VASGKGLSLHLRRRVGSFAQKTEASNTWCTDKGNELYKRVRNEKSTKNVDEKNAEKTPQIEVGGPEGWVNKENHPNKMEIKDAKKPGTGEEKCDRHHRLALKEKSVRKKGDGGFSTKKQGKRGPEENKRVGEE